MTSSFLNLALLWMGMAQRLNSSGSGLSLVLEWYERHNEP